MPPDLQPDEPLFTGRKRLRRPKRTVLIADKVARFFITLGGVGSIVAVSLVGLFLVYVVVPLFWPPSATPEDSFAERGRTGAGRAPTNPAPTELIHLAVDEHLTTLWEYHGDGAFVLRRLADGEFIGRRAVGDTLAPTAWNFPGAGTDCAFGFADGSLRTGTIGFATSYLRGDDVPPSLRDLKEKETAIFEDGVLQRATADQFRLQRFDLALDEPVKLGRSPIVLVDRSEGVCGTLLAALDRDGVLHLRELRRRSNLLTGEVVTDLTGGDVSLVDAGLVRPAAGELDLPRYLLLTGIGDNVMLGWTDGRLVRILSRDVSDPRFVEEVDLVPEARAELTCLEFQPGKSSLIAGDSLGRVRLWYRVNPQGTRTLDGTRLVLAEELPPGPAAVTALATSSRTRLIAAGFADGMSDLYYVTSERRLAEVEAVAGEPVVALALAPRDDHLIVATAAQLSLWSVDAPHPEISLTALLGRVWYEGYNEPAYVWQSSSGSDSFEPKYSLVPLIFGTLKATLYSMLFGLPLALLAAIYTSEFLHPRTKARVKPVVEMMASLPSVVLGFLAALVIAPFVEDVVPQTLTAFVTIPFALLLGSQLWQLLPRHAQLRRSGWKLPAMIAMLPLGLWLAAVCGPWVESRLFAGDVMAWLDGQVGSGLGGWLIILLPASALLVAVANSELVNPWLRAGGREWSRLQFAGVDLARFALSAAVTLALALGLSWLVSAAGWDPRGSFIDTYVQRNALIVGFVMGFAIIPIIYTISEDALNAVPNHLRAASLGAGATPWQTAVRVVIPPAMSGLFSAVMIGLGRAVGETMIVLMAAGNTPVLDWNIFNGFRTLSANIAVELPEAVQNSTHYRTLFLAALTLFLMTFALNTVAEAVRIRFRKKAFEL